MKLSILLPTHRDGLAAVSRVAQVCSWAGPEIEIIVRDNSGSARKRGLISPFKGDHCEIIIGDPCDPFENFLEVFKRAKGEFIFLVADDDFCFDHAIGAVLRVLEEFGKDPLVAGVTGHYAIETSKGTGICVYADVASDDVVKRVSGYLSYSGPNVLLYSALRREMVDRVMSLIRSMPVFLSFHDQILSVLYLLCGKFIPISRLLYDYDLGVWELPETAQKRDIEFYTAAGLDPVMNKLHWFLCGFEGAVLIRHSSLVSFHPLARRQLIANVWFSVMLARFRGSDRLAGESKFTSEAEKICAKLRASAGELSFQNMLADICSVIALFSKDKAQYYYDFWELQFNKRALFAS